MPQYWVYRLPDDHPESPGRYEYDVKGGPSAAQGGEIVAGPFDEPGKANDKAIELQWCQSLTDRQKWALGQLWFEFGNDGPRHSMSNHRFIQCILEHGEYNRTFFRPDPDCEDIVLKILNPDWFEAGLKRLGWAEDD